MAQKYYKELSNKILVQKEAKKERQGNDVAHLLLPNLVLHLDEGKRLGRSKVKKNKKKRRRRSPSLSSCSSSSYSLSFESEEEDQETKSSILH